ncbi:lysyl-tRNA synthetase, putative [Leishmania tarentolae]|uniref:Lysine--tRNA ligase n=1 Tax=Leishmania tarentolae TaxID=5689 RepID=A0A640KSS8_LEITA|nr:lysyl-tRNA synthetase, putative [Leishmania tarentolae]
MRPRRLCLSSVRAGMRRVTKAPAAALLLPSLNFQYRRTSAVVCQDVSMTADTASLTAEGAASSACASPPTSAPENHATVGAEREASRRKERRRKGRDRSPASTATSPARQASRSQRSGAASTTVSAGATLPLPRTILDFPNAYQPFDAVTPLAEFREKYDYIRADQRCSDASGVRVGGRVVSIRDMGSILFITIRSGEAQLQVLRQVNESFSKADLRAFANTLHTGDILGATGVPGRTVKGELSLYATEASILVPYVCTDQALCPDLKGFVPLTDTGIKYRYRFVDMMTNREVVQHFRKRHAITRALRNFLDARSFIEVETPVLHSVASGANAKPFVTHHNANNADLFLRVAPELYLKQCVVGGMERVYEIGRVFRNEDADRSHNPEFTTCEFYAAYHTYEDLMRMTEEILRHLALAANGTTKISVTSCTANESVEIDLAQPFRRVNAYDAVQEAAGVDLPPPTELNTPRGLAYMSAIMLRYNIPLPSVRTAAKMFDKLIDYFITDRVVEPTFVTDHPIFMSPLAMEQRARPGLSARFELFINGTEYCNAYSELNDPQEQYYRFQQQLLDRQTGDDEAMALDETFLKALQVGLPPTAGWGMGIDRVAMLLNGSSNIREEILFPLLRHDATSHDAKRRCKSASFFGFNHNMTLFCLNALEEEMLKRAAPTESLVKIRQLRQCLATMQQRDMETHAPDTGASRGWRYEATMAVLRLFCCRGKY